MSQFKQLDEHIHVAGQISASDITEASRLGIALIINNRPDGEAPGQPAAAEIGEAASAAGIAYRAIPVDHSGIRPDQVQAMAAALAEAKAKGPVLAFCRSGMRSTMLWALAEHSRGVDGATLIARAHAAGYDLGAIRGALQPA